MKKILFLLLISVGVFGQTVHRVTNGMNLQTVIDNAVSGDVIMVEAGVYGNININKKLTIIGRGYFLNNSNSVNDGNAIIGNCIISAVGTIFQSLICGSIKVNTDNVLVLRNKCTKITIGGDVATGEASFQANNVVIQQNYSSYISIHGQSINFKVSNNIFYGQGNTSGFTIGSSGYGLFKNNTFLTIGYYYGYYGNGAMNYTNTAFINNIFPSILNNQGSNTNFMIHVIPNVIENNLFSDTYTNVSNTNKFSIPLNTCFIAYSSNPNNLQEDARYQLAPNSPARGAGEGGTDCGAFGGDDPYVLSGIPSIPSIYQLTVPSQVPQNGTLNIQIKAKTNN